MGPFTVAVLALLVGAGGSAAPSEGCGDCHTRQRKAWERSFHARSAVDPLYRAMREWAREDAGDEVASLCVNCHTSRIRGAGNRTESVECRVCHQGTAAGSGPGGWIVDPERPVAAVRPGEAPHPTRATTDLPSGAICAPCHHALHNQRGIPLCTTGPEAQTRGSTLSCVRCHMGGGDHTVPGTTKPLLARAAALGIDERTDGIRITVINRGAGHALPTGSALRQVVLDVRVEDRNGTVLVHRRTVFAKSFEDADGHHPVPPWRAVRLHEDTRLRPGEARTVTVRRPPGATRVEAVLTHVPAPRPLLRRLGLVDGAALPPVVMVRAEKALRSGRETAASRRRSDAAPALYWKERSAAQ